jgi:two-component system, cell cycle sensor histidine kinase and response regulator CckA
MKIVDLNKLVLEMEKLLHRLIGEDLELSSELDPQLGKVKVDPGQIEQVILNLTVNARDAMPGGGKLVIRTSITEVGPERASDVTGGRQTIKPGSYAQLSISDTGVGMSEETKSRLFEPFFTTKEPGKGTGLGLSMVFGIVEQAGGRIEVESAPGRGSVFTILFPIIPTTDESVPAAGVDSSYSELGGTETILVVEDDSFVRKLVTNVLQRAGYRVLEAERGDAALRILETEARDPELLLTDLVMAGMSGSQLADKVAHSRPGIKIIFMSGYTSDAAAVKGIMDSTVAFLQKPFSPIRLLQKIRESLGKRLPASK